MVLFYGKPQCYGLRLWEYKISGGRTISIACSFGRGPHPGCFPSEATYWKHPTFITSFVIYVFEIARRRAKLTGHVLLWLEFWHVSKTGVKWWPGCFNFTPFAPVQFAETRFVEAQECPRYVWLTHLRHLRFSAGWTRFPSWLFAGNAVLDLGPDYAAISWTWSTAPCFLQHCFVSSFAAAFLNRKSCVSNIYLFNMTTSSTVLLCLLSRVMTWACVSVPAWRDVFLAASRWCNPAGGQQLIVTWISPARRPNKSSDFDYLRAVELNNDLFVFKDSKGRCWIPCLQNKTKRRGRCWLLCLQNKTKNKNSNFLI